MKTFIKFLLLSLWMALISCLTTFAILQFIGKKLTAMTATTPTNTSISEDDGVQTFEIERNLGPKNGLNWSICSSQDKLYLVGFSSTKAESINEVDTIADGVNFFNNLA